MYGRDAHRAVRTAETAEYQQAFTRAVREASKKMNLADRMFFIPQPMLTCCPLNKGMGGMELLFFIPATLFPDMFLLLSLAQTWCVGDATVHRSFPPPVI